MTDAVLTRCLISCMHMTIAETLESIRGLRSPVARTSHFGNNGAHNWGWLALGGNTDLLQWEHSLYGIDDIYVPWVVLGDRGVVEACYGPSGARQPEETGHHVSAVVQRTNRKYQRHLNYGIFAEHEGRDLMAQHFQMTESLSRQINASTTALISTELLGMEPVLTRLLRDLCRIESLHLLFNRWVRVSRKGYIVILKLRNIEYHGGGKISLYTKDCMRMFHGSIDSLIDLFFLGMRGVAERFDRCCFPSFQQYPWINGYSTYLLRALKEYLLDPDEETFWHAGGSSSQFYIHEEKVVSYLGEFREILVRLRYLPTGLQIRLIPTFSAQLFATRKESLEILESLLDLWRALLSRYGGAASHSLALLASQPNPLPIVEEFCRTLGAQDLAELSCRVAKFNAMDPHQLPIANVANHGHTTYNKYGIAQRNLCGASILFPVGLFKMRWGETELLVKTLALILSDLPG